LPGHVGDFSHPEPIVKLRAAAPLRDIPLGVVSPARHNDCEATQEGLRMVWYSKLLALGLVAVASLAEFGKEIAMAEEAPRPDDKPVARLVRYSGRVQGVGFRYTTADMARDHPVTGYVKNLDDGRVELYVEGKREAVDKFLEAVRTYWKRHIDKEQSEEKTAAGKYRRFEIAR
jgi:acylphosphatase